MILVSQTSFSVLRQSKTKCVSSLAKELHGEYCVSCWDDQYCAILTPLLPTVKSLANTDALFDDLTHYQSLTGVLQYLVIPCHGIANAIYILYQHMHLPKVA